MIPKIIHYCWFGGKSIPLETKVLIYQWHKLMPDYEIRCWSEDNFDINSVLWVRQAIQHKKWAFVADYVRLYALYNFGGIYMDTDVQVFKPYDKFLKYSFFSSIEIHDCFNIEGKSLLNDDNLPKKIGSTIPGLGILSAIIAAEPKNEYIGDCLNFYEKLSFVKNDGTFLTNIIIPDFLARGAVKYGFRYVDKTQYLNNNMIVFNSSVFAGNYNCYNEESYALHYCYGTWRKTILKNRIKWWYRHKKWALKKIMSICLSQLKFVFK